MEWGLGVVGKLYFSGVKNSNSWTIEETHKKELNKIRFRHNEVNFEATFDDHLNYSKCIIVFQQSSGYLSRRIHRT